MTAEPVERAEPETWYISASDSAEAVRVLQHADTELTKRRKSLKAANLDRWPGYQIRIYVACASLLMADERHGTEIHGLAEKLTKSGRPAGILLELQW